MWNALQSLLCDSVPGPGRRPVVLNRRLLRKSSTFHYYVFGTLRKHAATDHPSFARLCGTRGSHRCGNAPGPGRRPVVLNRRLLRKSSTFHYYVFGTLRKHAATDHPSFARLCGTRGSHRCGNAPGPGRRPVVLNRRLLRKSSTFHYYVFGTLRKHAATDHPSFARLCGTRGGHRCGPPRWPSGKASASRAEDPRFESRLRRDFFGVESYQ